MSSKLQKSLSDYNSTLVKEGEILYGNLGTFIGGRTLVSVPGRAGYVYVRLRTKLSELIEAFNSEVAQKYNTPVLVERKGNRYVVIGRNTETFSDWETNDPYIPQHAEQHIFDKDGGNMGGDPVWVYPYQFMPSLVTPFGSRGAANVFLHSYPLHTENGWKYTGNTGTPKLTQYNPDSGATLVLIALDAQTGNPAIFATTGTFIPESVTGTSQLISYLPQVSDLRYLPDSFVRLVSGTSSIGWSNIYDVRQFLSYSPSGTSSLSVNGNSGIDNLVVTGASVGVTGSYAYLEFTGSTGSSGVSDHEALSGLLGGSANNHFHLTPSQVIGLVSGTSTALHSHTGGIGTGTAGQVVKWGAAGDTLVDGALIPPATNILTLTATAASTLGLAITAGKTLTLTATDNFNLTIPATGTAALLGTANVFIAVQQITVATTTSNALILKTSDDNTTKNVFQVIKSTDAVLARIDANGDFSNNLLQAAYITIGGLPTDRSYSGIWLGQASPSATNYTFLGNASISLLNNPTSVDIRIANLSMLAVASTSISIPTAKFLNIGANYLYGNGNNLIINSPTNFTMRIGGVDKIEVATSGFITHDISTATTNAILEGYRLRATVNSTGVGAAGFGVGLTFYAETATNGVNQLMAQIAAVWVDATNATRKAKLQLSAYDTAQRIGIDIEASGTAPKLGFFGGTTAIQQVLAAYTSDGEGAAYTGIDNAQAGAVYAQVSDLNQLRVAYETLRASYDDLRTKLQTSTIVG